MMRFFKIALCVLTFPYIAIVAFYYFAQDGFIFPAPELDVSTINVENLKRVTIDTPDGEKLFGLHHPSETNEATILLFHGNATAAVSQRSKANALIDGGFGVLLVSYRGYPGSTGKPSEEGLTIDATAAHDFIMRERPQKIGVFGHSLGTGVGINLAVKRDIFALFLEAPFKSLLAVAQERYPVLPVAPLLRHPFRSDLLISDIKAPMFIIHGDNDQTVPIRHGQELHKLAPQRTEFLQIEGGGHSDLERFGGMQHAVRFFRENL